MACPYFDPGERVPGSSGSLGDLYLGQCHADRERAWAPDEKTAAARCNVGYARGCCGRFPNDDGPDAIRFSVAGDDSQGIRILYAVERDHRPLGSGALEYRTQSAAFVGTPLEQPLERLAAAYVRSYLRRTR
jgi:hypothetical protein